MIMMRSVPAHEASERLTSAVIGAGGISEEHLRFLAGSPHTKLIAVCDLSAALARFAADRFGADHVLTDHHRLLEEVRPDVVHVLTPPHTHVPIVRDCLEGGAHVIVEKPLAPTHEEFRELWSLAQDRRRLLIEDHNYRFNKLVLKIRQLADGGRLGEIREVDVRLTLRLRDPGERYADENQPHPSHRLPAGVIHEFVSHLCYLALCFVPEAPANGDGEFGRVTAAWRNNGGGSLFKYDDLDATIICGGVRASLRFSCTSWPERFTLSIGGTGGTVSTDLFHPHLHLEVPRAVGRLTHVANQWTNGWHLVRMSVANCFAKLRQSTPYEGLNRFLEQTYASLRNGSDPPVTYRDMDRTSRLIETLLDEGSRI